ncbi:MAG TPA: hypothetical protein VG407_07645 [Caulobacteraceae bacterium]|jgi:hypothetical protein|nr:hypothetical protein [Caulobacteraceae bacterium]
MSPLIRASLEKRITIQPTGRLDDLGPRLIGFFAADVPIAVEFDNEPRLDAREVDDVAPDRHLTPKLQSCAPAIGSISHTRRSAIGARCLNIERVPWTLQTS